MVMEEVHNTAQIAGTGDGLKFPKVQALPRLSNKFMPRSPTRCSWPQNDLSIRYHDEEWGVPSHDDRHLFEFLILEGAQAGLSWDTILQKRENYRAALDGFDPKIISRYDRPQATEAAEKSRNRAQSTQDRLDRTKCAGVPGSTKGVWFI